MCTFYVFAMVIGTGDDKIIIIVFRIFLLSHINDTQPDVIRYDVRNLTIVIRSNGRAA